MHFWFVPIAFLEGWNLLVVHVCLCVYWVDESESWQRCSIMRMKAQGVDSVLL